MFLGRGKKLSLRNPIIISFWRSFECLSDRILLSLLWSWIWVARRPFSMKKGTALITLETDCVKKLTLEKQSLREGREPRFPVFCDLKVVTKVCHVPSTLENNGPRTPLHILLKKHWCSIVHHFHLTNEKRVKLNATLVPDNCICVVSTPFPSSAPSRSLCSRRTEICTFVP